MSSNRLNNTKRRYEDLIKKDITPKNSLNSPKMSPTYTSFRGSFTSKQDLTPKSKIIRPVTSKINNYNQNFFNVKDEKKQSLNSSIKRLERESISKRALNLTQYQYQPRSKSKSPTKIPQQIIKHQIQVKPPQNIQTVRGIKSYPNQKPDLPKILSTISNFQKAKHSVKSNGLIKAYAASTNVGPVRQYNQDRVAIILNITKPAHCQDWKKAAYFGVFDGHGGIDCADFLRDNLHIYISRQKSFPDDMQNALNAGFEKCEKTFIDHSKSGRLDRSGSCAIVSFFYGDMLYLANVGDSRAIMSSRLGQIVNQLSIDHKASCQYQQKRIIDVGGKIYQTMLKYAQPNAKIFYEGTWHDSIIGPHRVMPGRLSTTRTFGDIEAKLPELKGNPKAIIYEPQITSLKITGNQDFILLASDGIFDKMSNCQIIKLVWETLKRDEGKYSNLHQFCGLAVENVMKLAFHKKTADNITVVLVALQGLQRYFLQRQNRNMSPNSSFSKTIVPDSRKNQLSRYDTQLQRKYIGRSFSPSTYSSLRSHSLRRY